MNGNTDIWSTYLRSSSRGIQDGWCIQPSIASDQRCCDATGETRGISTSCFTSWATAPWKGCLDPSRILTSLEEPRCHEEAKCLDGNICVRPIDGSFLRVTLADPPQTIPNRVVLWKGPSTEILEEVQVSSFRPRLSSMPLWLPLLLSRTSWYLKQVSLCLFFFNLLPMRQLDGGKLWHLLLRDSTDTYDLEEVRTYTRPSFLYRIHRGVFRVVPWLLTSSVVLLALRMWA
ncbi:hypothetical protein BDN72DRAFT_844872 [Pluteus cervinus]|uniref:Uncharacterized protein n=1 Tax=Pluteus cervinus TaxID=181527 RepID=A0ACD3AJX0_9AGAR|nr:hypothetical protein BDN72DRAFT_844872 [Pluteus cervinus]